MPGSHHWSEKRWYPMLLTLISILIQKQYSPDFSARSRCSLRIPNKLSYCTEVWKLEEAGYVSKVSPREASLVSYHTRMER